MFDQMFIEIIESVYLEPGNRKVKEESLEEYLNGLSKEDILRMIFINFMVNYDIDGYKNIKKLSKKDLINYVINNLYEVLDVIFSVLNYDYVNQLKRLVSINNVKSFDLNDRFFNMFFINYLKVFSIAKIEYDKNNKSLKFFMPEEFKEIFNSLLNDKNKIKDIKLYSDICSFVENVLQTYGVIDLDTLYNIVNTRLFKVNKNELEYVLSTKGVVEKFRVFCYEEILLITSFDFEDVKTSIDFYNSLSIDYKLYNKKDYELISNGNYVLKLKSYKSFIKYICDNFYLERDEIDEFKDMIVNDYIYSAQTDINVANNNFRENIVKYFDIDNFMIEYLLNMVKKIYNDYPKWNKRGNV